MGKKSRKKLCLRLNAIEPSTTNRPIGDSRRCLVIILLASFLMAGASFNFLNRRQKEASHWLMLGTCIHRVFPLKSFRKSWRSLKVLDVENIFLNGRLLYALSNGWPTHRYTCIFITDYNLKDWRKLNYDKLTRFQLMMPLPSQRHMYLKVVIEW